MKRRSLRHLGALASLSGLITLIVAVTAIDPAWFAVGPLLLALVDFLAFSPLLRHRLRGRRWKPTLPRPASLLNRPDFFGRNFYPG
jgi:hypothetical protein